MPERRPRPMVAASHPTTWRHRSTTASASTRAESIEHRQAVRSRLSATVRSSGDSSPDSSGQNQTSFGEYGTTFANHGGGQLFKSPEENHAALNRDNHLGSALLGRHRPSHEDPAGRERTSKAGETASRIQGRLLGCGQRSHQRKQEG